MAARKVVPVKGSFKLAKVEKVKKPKNKHAKKVNKAKKPAAKKIMTLNRKNHLGTFYLPIIYLSGSSGSAREKTSSSLVFLKVIMTELWLIHFAVT